MRREMLREVWLADQGRLAAHEDSAGNGHLLSLPRAASHDIASLPLVLSAVAKRVNLRFSAQTLKVFEPSTKLLHLSRLTGDRQNSVGCALHKRRPPAG